LTGSEFEIVLQIEDADGTFECKGFTGVPAARRSLIALVSSGSAAGRRLVRDLAASLETTLRSSSPQVECAKIECPASPEEMNPPDYPDRRKVLVLIGSPDACFGDQSWYGRWDSDEHHSCVMLVLPPGRYEAQFDGAILANDTHLLRRVNAAGWNKEITEAIPSVLARAEITSSTSRVFISYRRLETLPVALQLFDRLVHEGFDVFLDRFSIPPGFDFQRRLMQELEDKSMAVLLESKSLKESKWTQHEIDFAKRHRLGMVALRMPNVEELEVLRSIPYDAREDLDPADFVKGPRPVPDPSGVGTLDEWPVLTPAALDRVVARIKTAHAQALFRRRVRLRADVVAALNTAGIHVDYSDVGPLFAGPHGHVVWLTTRPPEVEDFRSVDGARLARKFADHEPRGIIVGPMAALEPDRQQQLGWLRRVTQCLAFDEGNLPAFAAKMAGPLAEIE
jgi:TIR domain-containing protein